MQKRHQYTVDLIVEDDAELVRIEITCEDCLWGVGGEDMAHLTERAFDHVLTHTGVVK